jgi:MFS family permease
LWGSLQIATGWLSDSIGRTSLIVSGMLLQAVAIGLATLVESFGGWLVAVSLVGVGTAMVYPTLLAAIGDSVHPLHRSSALGVYRFWRDAGAIAGALISGLLADLLGFAAAIQVVAALTAVSGVVAAITLSRPELRTALEVQHESHSIRS